MAQSKQRKLYSQRHVSSICPPISRQLGSRRRMVRAAITLAMAFGLGTVSGFAWAQSAASPGGVIQPDFFRAVTFQWNGLMWNIPKRFFQYIQEDPDNIWIQLYIRKDGVLLPDNEGGLSDTFIDIHINKYDSEDPNPYNGTDSLALVKLPIFEAFKPTGLRYLGSFSGSHYFKMAHYKSAYVRCSTVPIKADWESNSLSLKGNLRCDVVFWLPHHNFAWVSAPGIKLLDVDRVFSSVWSELATFYQQGNGK